LRVYIKKNIDCIYWKFIVHIIIIFHEKNGFAEKSKILTEYRSVKSNFVELSK